MQDYYKRYKDVQFLEEKLKNEIDKPLFDLLKVNQIEFIDKRGKGGRGIAIDAFFVFAIKGGGAGASGVD